ncbi:MAG: hypothetical protein O6930_05880 [Gammaproteobacteria bacterium]|nr:hypothetical protein [Gammaproteobacteria bacterium]
MRTTMHERVRGFLGCALILAWPLSTHAQPDLEGIWGMDRSLFRQYSEIQYTEEGQRRLDAFDIHVDDPSLQCIPSGLGRVWDEPDTTVEINQLDDRVVIRYEMFDLVRTIMLTQNGHPLQPNPSTVDISGVAMPTMGHSIAWYEDDALVIDTLAYAPGNITTLLRYPLQSEALRSIERIHRDEADRLIVDITYVDPIILAAPLISKNRYLRSDFGITVYGCLPEDAGYDVR